MRPGVVIHIGPPKTGTTSLQVALEQVTFPELFFGGTFQPRDRNAGSLSQALYRICTDDTETKSGLQSFREELRRLVGGGRTVLLSEEMFLLEQEQISMEQKIVRLREALAGFDCRILISARSGASALPSLYQEIFASLPFTLQKSFADFCRDARASCYDYSWICDLLKSVGFAEIIVFDFEDLARGDLRLGALVGLVCYDDFKLSVERHNVGSTAGKESERTLPKVSLKSALGSATVRRVINSLGVRSWPGYRRLVNLLESIELLPSGGRQLIVPGNVAERMDRSYQEALTRYDRMPSENSAPGT